MFLSSLLILCLGGDDPIVTRPIAPERAVALENALSPVVLANVPRPLYLGKSHWGETKATPNGLKWIDAGRFKRPVLQYAQKNHGTWRRYAVQLLEGVATPFKLHVDHLAHAGNNTLAVDLRIEADLHFTIDQINWNHGVKLFSGTARGTVHFTLRLKGESKLVIEPGGGLLPIIAYRFRVIEAMPRYSQLKFTHIPGLGGEAAEQLGRWAHEALQQWKPSLERKLIDKLTEKLLKAADTKEVQISLSGVERKKSK